MSKFCNKIFMSLTTRLRNSNSFKKNAAQSYTHKSEIKYSA